MHFASVYRYEPVPATDSAGYGFAANLFFKLLLQHGVFVWERRLGFFTMAHTDEHIDEIMHALESSLFALRTGCFSFTRKTTPTTAVSR